MHVHVFSPDGEEKFWIKPVVALANEESADNTNWTLHRKIDGYFRLC